MVGDHVVGRRRRRRCHGSSSSEVIEFGRTVRLDVLLEILRVEPRVRVHPVRGDVDVVCRDTPRVV
jgi:hypothetical protein